MTAGHHKKETHTHHAAHHPMKHTTAEINIVVDQSPWYVRFFQWCVNAIIRRK
jgi:hypothetical protein